MHLDVESLRTLLTVLDLGSMTRAADALNLSQSAVSWKIKRLEERVGRTLILRDGRTLTPSRDGSELAVYARSIVDTHDQAVARLSSSDLTGNVRIGATEEVTAAGMAALLGRFNRLHPGATIEFVVDFGYNLDRLLNKGQLDVAVMQIAAETYRETDLHLWTNKLTWVTAADWTFESGVIPLITFGQKGFYRPMAEERLRRAGMRYRVAFAAPSAASVLAAVDAGLGVGIIATMSMEESPGAGRIVEWPRAKQLDPLPNTYQVARAATGYRTELTGELLAHIEEELSQETLA